MVRPTRLAAAIALLALQALAAAPATLAGPLRFVVSYDAAIPGPGPFSGRVYVMLTARDHEPRFGPSWQGTEPFYAVDVTDWKPGEPLVFDDGAVSYPGPFSELAAGTWAVQAVMRSNHDSPSNWSGPGTANGEELRRDLGPDSGDVALVIDRMVEARPEPPQAQRVRVVEVPSDLLSAFHGRDVVMRATVVLPQGYGDDPQRRYPALYSIGGFGATHRIPPRQMRHWDATGFSDRIVRIVLDPSCLGGHHVFADSANNGPRGAALVRELIPRLEREFRLEPSQAGRFLTGHSSGGWSSLWLQVAYPEFFGGVWSLAPDPIDFRDFQQIDLYEPGANVFRDDDVGRRPIARSGGQPIMWYDEFAGMEVVYGDGGQLRSFDWVFSPRGPDGRPQRLFDPGTGAVDPVVAEAWKRYDIGLILKEHWATLGPALAGRITIIAGGEDTFFLEGAVEKVKADLAALGADITIEIVPGADHGSFADAALDRRIDSELLAIYEGPHPPP